MPSPIEMLSQLGMAQQGGGSNAIAQVLAQLIGRQGTPTEDVPMPQPRNPIMRQGVQGNATEDELRSISDQMGGQGAYQWQGDRVPTQQDLDYLAENGGDAAYADFFWRFPDFVREQMMMRGARGMSSPDRYAMPDEEWQKANANRQTQIDKR